MIHGLHVYIVVIDIINDVRYGFDFLLPTSTSEYAPEDVSPCSDIQPG